MTPEQLPDCPVPEGGRLIDASASLLDRQVLDADGEPVGVVDDLELDDLSELAGRPEADSPTLRNLVHGPIVLQRIFGGRRPLGHLNRVGWDQVRNLGSALELAVKAEELRVSWLEKWLADNVIARIPGGRHVPR